MGFGIQEPNTELVNWLSAFFTQRTEPNFSLGQTISTYLALPGLRGFWPSNGVSDTGQMLDISGNQLLLTNVASTPIGYESSTLTPRAHYNGTTQYHSRSDSAYFDITGTEAYIEQNGLTMGCWINFDNAAGSVEDGISKWGSAGQRSYRLFRSAAGDISGQVSVDGTAIIGTTGTASSQSTWLFVAMQYDPSTELSVFVNATKTQNTTSIPASIFNGNTNFQLAARSGATNPLDGKISLAFLCASALSDAIINNLYMQSRGLFGV